MQVNKTVKYEGPDLELMEARLREEINKKMEICVKLINSSGNSKDKGQKGLA